MDQETLFHGTLVPLLTRLESKIDAQNAELVSLRAALPVKDTYTITDIARKLGVAQSTLYKSCWNLPNFGKSDIGSNPRRWRQSTVDKWYATPEVDRRDVWENMSEAERRKVFE